MFYNDDLKKEFINHYSNYGNTKNSCIRLFETTEKYEVKWEKDIYSFDVRQLMEIIDLVTGSKYRSRYTALSILKEYVRWCRYTKKIECVSDAIEKTSAETIGLDNMRRTYIANPIEMQMYLDSMFAPVESNSVENTIRCYLWLAYLGVKEEDVLSITEHDFEFETMTLKYNGRNLPVFRESLSCIKSCIRAKVFKRQTTTTSKDFYFDRVRGTALLRGIKSDGNVATYRSYVSRAVKKLLDKDQTSKKATFKKVFESGEFYRIREKEIAGIAPDFTYIVDVKSSREKDYVFNSRTDSLARRRKRAHDDAAEDYNRWKLVFCG